MFESGPEEHFKEEVAFKLDLKEQWDFDTWGRRWESQRAFCTERRACGKIQRLESIRTVSAEVGNVAGNLKIWDSCFPIVELPLCCLRSHFPLLLCSFVLLGVTSVEILGGEELSWAYEWDCQKCFVYVSENQNFTPIIK